MYNNQSFIKPRPGIQLNRAYPLAQGLVGYWPLNELAGSGSYDVLHRIKMTLPNGNTWGGSIMGGGILLNGTSEFGRIPSAWISKYIDYNKPFTVSIRFTFRTYSATGQYQFMGQISANSNYDELGFAIYGNDKVSSILYSRNGSQYDGRVWETTSAQNLVANKLYDYTWVYDGINSTTAMKIYRDGVLEPTTVLNEAGNITQSIWSSNLLAKDVYVGARDYPAGTGDSFFPGIIDSIRIYNRMLNIYEIKDLYINPHIDFHGSKTSLLAGAK